MKTHNYPPVRLRAIEPEDLDLLYKIENDVELWGIGNTNVPYSRYALHDYVANSSEDIYVDRQARLMAENYDRDVVGIVDIVNFEPQHMRAEVGIVIEKNFRRKGYACSALKQVAAYSLNVLHLHQLYVIVDINNTPSVKLFEKMGYEIKSELEDWLYDGKKYNKAVLMQLFL